MEYSIFTDGASRGNPGPGGWGSVLIKTGKKSVTVVEIGGRQETATNNRMELTAAIGALKKLQNLENETDQPNGGHDDIERVTVYSDSSYLINGITKWVKQWKKNGWVTKTREEVLNRDLWAELDTLAVKFAIKWKYVGGHVGIIGNERCDEIATAFADGKNPELFNGLLSEYKITGILNIETNGHEKRKKSRKGAKAYSYVSVVDGKVEVHRTWPECEKRVKGVRGAKYKKALYAGDEGDIIIELGGAGGVFI